MKLFLLILFLFCGIDAYKILLVFPFPIKSLSILGEGFVRSLLNAGHEVTYITVFPVKGDYGNKLHQIDVSDNLKLFPSGDDYGMEALFDGKMTSYDIQMLQYGAIQNAISTFENKNVQKLWEDHNERFDVVIVDYFETEIYAALSLLYDCPMIWSYSMGAHWHVLRLIDQPTSPAYTADYTSPNVPPFSFKQRFEELWLQIKWTWSKRFKTLPIEKEAYEKYFGKLLGKLGKPLPSYQDLIYNASLIFANENHAVGNIPATPQNFKLIGGFHIENPAKPLPEDLQTLMDNSTHGVIYFSLGSNWRSKDLPKSTIKGLLKMFGELKQTVIWKFEEPLPDVPKNVFILHWAPQPSILAHRNCLFFISHGGLLSSTEAVHFGVPIIGVPILLDQALNIERAVRNGYAIKVRLSYQLPQDLKAAIENMLNDKQYKQKAVELSKIYHDRPISPSKELVHWVEHVIKTRGAPHLRSPALNVHVYQKMYLDLAAILISSTSLVIIVIRSACKRKTGRKLKMN